MYYIILHFICPQQVLVYGHSHAAQDKVNGVFLTAFDKAHALIPLGRFMVMIRQSNTQLRFWTNPELLF